MNEKLLEGLKIKRLEFLEQDRELRVKDSKKQDELGKAATEEEKKPIRAEINAIRTELVKVDESYAQIKKEEKEYKDAYSVYVTKVGERVLASEEKFEEALKAEEEALKKVKDTEKELAKKYNIAIEAKKEEEPIEDEVEEVTEEKRPIGGYIVAGLVGAAITLGAGALFHGCQAEEAIVQEDEEPEKEEEKELKPGEYGTFLDVTDNEQVEARAQYIYDNYYAEILPQLSESEKELCTPEKIANTIRVLNGELPLDAEGNKYYDVNLVDDFGQLYVKTVCNIPSSPELDKIYHVPSHMFAVDGSQTSDFMKAYDEDYSKVAEGRNARDGEKTREAIASLGTKMWNQWVLQGMYGDVSPYDLPASQRNLAFLGTMAPYAPYVFEYNLNAMQPVCIEACVDYSTKTMKELTVNEIYVGYTSGQWDTVIAKAAGIEVNAEPDSIAFHQDLSETLAYKKQELNQLTLK